MVHAGVLEPAGETDSRTNNTLQGMGAVIEACTGALGIQGGRDSFYPPRKRAEVILKLSMVSSTHEKQRTHSVKAERTKTVLPPAVH